MAYGVEIGNGGMQYLNVMTTQFPGANYLIGDWSGFDTTVSAWLIRDAFKILEGHIDFEHVSTHATGQIWPVSSVQSKRRWKTLVKYFIDTPIQLSSAERFMKHGGVPSGTAFTYLIDSVINAIIIRYCIYQFVGALPLADLYLGDDFVVVTSQPLNLELLTSFAKQQFSMDFNSDKSYQPGTRRMFISWVTTTLMASLINQSTQ